MNSTILSTFFALGVFFSAIISVLIAKYRSNFLYGSSFIGDTSFVFQKILLLLTNLCFMYFNYYLLAPPFFLEFHPTLKIFVVLGLMLWCLVAIALLPFNHTVLVKDTTDIIDDSATKSLAVLYFLVFKLPLFLSLVILVSYYTYFCIMKVDVFAKTNEGKPDHSKFIFGFGILKKALAEVTPVIQYIPQNPIIISQPFLN